MSRRPILDPKDTRLAQPSEVPHAYELGYGQPAPRQLSVADTRPYLVDAQGRLIARKVGFR